MGSLFLAFLGVSIVVIVTPGPDTTFTIRNTLFGGRACGVFTALGIAAGQTVWAVATRAGIVAILIASQPLFLAVKYAGAIYLVYLGIQALREAIAPSQAAAVGIVQPSFRLPPPVALRQGLISDLRQSENGRVLRQPAAAIRNARPGELFRLAASRRVFRRDDVRLADLLRRGDRQSRRCPAQADNQAPSKALQACSSSGSACASPPNSANRLRRAFSAPTGARRANQAHPPHRPRPAPGLPPACAGKDRSPARKTLPPARRRRSCRR